LSIFIYLTCFFLGANVCLSQAQFQLVVGDSSNIGEARTIIQTLDGGYVAAGENDTFGDIYIIKLNSSGQLQWSRTVGGTLQDLAFSVTQTTDGGYIVAGYSEVYQFFRTVFIKLNPEGNIEWTRGLNSGDPVWSVVQTTDGGYAAAISPGEGGFAPDRMIIVKLNNMGILQWSKKIGGHCYARCIKQTTDGGYIVAGATDSIDSDMFIVKFDSKGILQWAKTIGGSRDDFAYSIVQTSDGGFAVAGRTSSFPNGDKMYLAKLDSIGLLQWTKVISVYLDRAYSIVQTTDGGFAVAGYTGAHSSMFILKLNPIGSLLWSRVVDYNPGLAYAYSIIQTTDGGYATAGYGGISGARGFYIVKFDNNGNTCGNTVSHSISVDSGGILGSHIPLVTNITLMDTLLTPPTSSHGFVTQLCVIGIQPISSEIPDKYNLYQNYPNPFNPTTYIRYDIPQSSQVTIKIYDILGKEIFSFNEYKQAGSYEVQFDGTNFASGMYFYSLEANGYKDVKKMV
ncbi:MAG: T9SS type A sorting domain-containing protein, partial [Ignavibacteria bacterium]|nr:T9SS type A sorting domain-containing protein [Ignavibacteria bacterium]